MKSGGILILAVIAWLAYQAGKTAGATEVLSAPPYPGAVAPGY